MQSPGQTRFAAESTCCSDLKGIGKPCQEIKIKFCETPFYFTFNVASHLSLFPPLFFSSILVSDQVFSILFTGIPISLPLLGSGCWTISLFSLFPVWALSLFISDEQSAKRNMKVWQLQAWIAHQNLPPALIWLGPSIWGLSLRPAHCFLVFYMHIAHPLFFIPDLQFA